MSLSDERIESLLNGYLDDTLSEDERSMTQKLLDEDPDLMIRLIEMRQISDSLKQLARADASIKLDDAFADRVLQSAIMRARDEGLSHDHPLMRVAEQPMKQLDRDRATFPSRSWMWVAAIAASILLMVSFAISRDDGRMVPESPGIGDLAGQGSPEASGQPGDPSVTESIDLPNGAISPPERSGSIVADNGKPDASVLTENMPKAMEPAAELARNDIVNNDIASNSSVATTDSRSDTVVFQAGQTVKASGAVMVLNVRQTVEGRMGRAVEKALQLASISSSDKREVTSEVAAAAADAVELPEGQRVRLMYLEASAKSIDRFFVTLFSDREGIESVAMSLSMAAPINDSINQLIPPHATTVAHENGIALQLLQNAADVDTLVSQLDQLEFADMDPAVAALLGQGLGKKADGPDEPAQVLVVIR